MGVVAGSAAKGSVTVRRRVLVAGAVVAATLLAASAANAQLPGDPGAVDQYVEDVPTGSGKTYPVRDKPRKSAVPESVAQQIAEQGGADAPLLTEIVSSSTYGAPQKRNRTDRANRDDDKAAEEQAAAGAESLPSEASVSGAVSSAITAAEDGDSRRLAVLIAVLVALSIGLVVAAGARQRGTGRP